MSKKIYWPESQQCVGCKHGCFLINEPESSTYICSEGLDTPVESCFEPDVSEIEDETLYENEDLVHIRDQFHERVEKGLRVDLGDFEELIREIVRREIEGI